MGIIFMVAGFFYVVEPYFQYQAYQRVANEKRKAIQQQLSETSQRLEKINKVKSTGQRTLERVLNIIRSLPENLHREVLPEMARYYSNNGEPRETSFHPMESYRPFGMPQEITGFEAAVNWYLEDWFGDLIDDRIKSMSSPFGLFP